MIDATGKYVVPGGVDAHTHMEMPFGGTFAADTFETGTRAAAWGGTTTIIDFAVQSMGGALREGLDAWHAKAEGNCAIDYGFHMILADVNERSLKEMDILVGEGVTSFKLFMAYPGRLLQRRRQDPAGACRRRAENGGLIMMHAENGIAIDVLVEQALAAGDTDPRYHGMVRKALLEAEATHRAIKLAQVAGAPLYIVHLSRRPRPWPRSPRPATTGFNVVRRDLPAVPVPVHRRPAAPGLRGRQVRLLDAAAARAEHQASPVARAAHQRPVQVVSTDHCPFCFTGAEGAGQGRLLQDPQRAARRGDTGWS